jgi:hypothetical protein
MADGFRSKMFRDVARYAHKANDGTIRYFESDGVQSSEGDLPPGTDPEELAAQGFTFLDGDAYERTRASLDPIQRAENADADALSDAFDASMGTTPTSKPGAPMDEMLTPEMMQILQQYAQEGRLDELFQPFQQEQGVLDQQMQLAQGMRERGPQRSSPTGALLGGLSNAVGNIGGAMLQKKGLEGQTALGQRMQGDASGRVGAILKAAMQRKGINPDTGLMTPAVDDATLAGLFSGG